MGERMLVLGKLPVRMQYEDQPPVEQTLVVTGDGPPLLGRNWLKSIRLTELEKDSCYTAARSQEA